MKEFSERLNTSHILPYTISQYLLYAIPVKLNLNHNFDNKVVHHSPSYYLIHLCTLLPFNKHLSSVIAKITTSLFISSFTQSIHTFIGHLLQRISRRSCFQTSLMYFLFYPFASHFTCISGLASVINAAHSISFHLISLQPNPYKTTARLIYDSFVDFALMLRANVSTVSCCCCDLSLCSFNNNL